MLFRVNIALFVLFNTLKVMSFASAAGAAEQSEITVVGPTDDTAAFIAMRPVTTPMQPEVRPMTTAGTLPQQTAEKPQAQQAMPVTMPQTMRQTMPGREAEMPEQVGRETMRGTGKKQSGREMPTIMPVSTGFEMQTRMMERLENMLGRPALTTSERVMLRGVITRMRGRRLQRRAMRPEMPRVIITRVEPTLGAPQQEPERPTMMMERPAMERPTMERPTTERPMTTPETGQVTRPASEMSIRGARYNPVVGDVEISRAMLERGQRTVPQSAIREVEFNTFIGRIRGEHTELGRSMEPQWEQVWMPRRQFVRRWEY